MTLKEIHEYLLSFPNTWLDFPFGEEVSVYKTCPPSQSDRQTGHSENNEGKMFALIAENSKPIRLSLKCDPLLAEKLRETYETVLPGYHLNKKHWNTVLITGQIPDDELKGFMRLSYDLVNGN
jgi:predicted DNA-binding protein (MmcQ/YjbR family)